MDKSYVLDFDCMVTYIWKGRGAHANLYLRPTYLQRGEGTGGLYADLLVMGSTNFPKESRWV